MKRKQEDPQEGPSKRFHAEAEDPEDLEAILAQIAAAESSEVLARKLQNEGSSGLPIEVDGPGDESDEAMARRLAAEWGVEAAVPAPTASKPQGEPYRGDDRITPDGPLRLFESLFTGNRSCPNCEKELVPPRGFVVFSVTTPPPTLVSLLHAPCTSCKTNYCRGCLKPITCGLKCKGATPKPRKSGEIPPPCIVMECCAEGRCIALYEALGGLDRQYIGERSTSDERARKSVTKKAAASASVGPGGTGYSTGGHHSAATASTKNLADHWDEILARGLTTITHLLPAPYADGPAVYDMLPHQSIGYLLALSHFPTILGDLLRNDSVTDWISRSELYYAVIAILRRLAECELTVGVLIDERFERSEETKHTELEEWMWGESEISWQREKTEYENEEGPLERAPTLYSYFKKLTRQCEAFLTGAEQLMEGADPEMEETVIKATSLCGDITAARDDIERAMNMLGRSPDGVQGKGKAKANPTAADLEKDYRLTCERLAFKHVIMSPDGNYSRFNYKKELHASENASRTPKDRMHMVKELAVMATCLPPGVWVRVDEVRNDVIKVMIAGPGDTPYDGGLYEFDCFLPIQYPNTPPLMHLRTTGGGKVRFNPNLYANGKVCLSLLGTWPGRPEEQWSPKSTLLQVLVSIQSMILIDAPYFNEPGHGQANLSSPQSISYNKNVVLQNVRWAIVDWFEEEQRTGMWGEVIKTHFTLRKDHIKKQVAAWAKRDKTLRSYREIRGDGHYAHRGLPERGGPSIDLVKKVEDGLRSVEGWAIDASDD